MILRGTSLWKAQREWWRRNLQAESDQGKLLELRQKIRKRSFIFSLERHFCRENVSYKTGLWNARSERRNWCSQWGPIWELDFTLRQTSDKGWHKTIRYPRCEQESPGGNWGLFSTQTSSYQVSFSVALPGRSLRHGEDGQGNSNWFPSGNPQIPLPLWRGRGRVGVVTSGISRRFVSIPPHPAPLPRGEREFPDEN